jgi:endogenous inhibitor of DNA gyrase (YacG/DUF329 family)
MKKCPNCHHSNLNNASQCDKCGYYFDDTIKCKYCGKDNLKAWEFCINCHKELYSNSVHEENRKNYDDNEEDLKTISFECIVCNNKFMINANDDFNVFICKKCRSIFLYEWKNNKLVINVIKKEEFFPDNIKEIITIIYPTLLSYHNSHTSYIPFSLFSKNLTKVPSLQKTTNF